MVFDRLFIKSVSSFWQTSSGTIDRGRYPVSVVLSVSSATLTNTFSFTHKTILPSLIVVFIKWSVFMTFSKKSVSLPFNKTLSTVIVESLIFRLEYSAERVSSLLKVLSSCKARYISFSQG